MIIVVVMSPDGGTEDEPASTLVGITGVVAPGTSGVSVGAGVVATGVVATGVDGAGVSDDSVSTGGGTSVLSPGPAGIEGVSVGVTGHQVVDTKIVEVVTCVDSAGQFVTVGAHCVIVTSLVLYTVEIVDGTELLPGG